MRLKITISINNKPINEQNKKLLEIVDPSPILNIKRLKGEPQEEFKFEPHTVNGKDKNTIGRFWNKMDISKLKYFIFKYWKKLGVFFLILCAFLADKFIWAKLIVQGFIFIFSFIMISILFLIVIGIVLTILVLLSGR